MSTFYWTFSLRINTKDVDEYVTPTYINLLEVEVFSEEESRPDSVADWYLSSSNQSTFLTLKSSFKWTYNHPNKACFLLAERSKKWRITGLGPQMDRLYWWTQSCLVPQDHQLFPWWIHERKRKLYKLSSKPRKSYNIFEQTL